MSELAEAVLPSGLTTPTGACSLLCALTWFLAFAGVLSWLTNSIAPLFTLGILTLLVVPLLYVRSFLIAIGQFREAPAAPPEQPEAQGKSVSRAAGDFQEKGPALEEVPPLLMSQV